MKRPDQVELSEPVSEPVAEPTAPRARGLSRRFIVRVLPAAPLAALTALSTACALVEPLATPTPVPPRPVPANFRPPAEATVAAPTATIAQPTEAPKATVALQPTAAPTPTMIRVEPRPTRNPSEPPIPGEMYQDDVMQKMAEGFSFMETTTVPTLRETWREVQQARKEKKMRLGIGTLPADMYPRSTGGMIEGRNGATDFEGISKLPYLEISAYGSWIMTEPTVTPALLATMYHIEMKRHEFFKQKGLLTGKQEDNDRLWEDLNLAADSYVYGLSATLFDVYRPLKAQGKILPNNPLAYFDEEVAKYGSIPAGENRDRLFRTLLVRDQYRFGAPSWDWRVHPRPR